MKITDRDDMDWILSCDWGTSSFRLRLARASSMEIEAEVRSSEGIAFLYDLWKKAGSPEDRMAFYLDHVLQNIQKLPVKRIGMDSRNIPVVFSGMASSGLGMKELDYAVLPVSLGGKEIPTAFRGPDDRFPYPVLLISGVRSGSDVMRGEETQLIGLCSLIDIPDGSNLFVMPGTHSKHIRIENGEIRDFKTFMTGEFFNLLSRQSILAESIAIPGPVENQERENAFRRGVRVGAENNILHAAFSVRTRYLAEPSSDRSNYDYLSGIVIGTELRELRNHRETGVFIAGEEAQAHRYALAAEELKIERVEVVSSTLWDQAVIRGHEEIKKHMTE